MPSYPRLGAVIRRFRKDDWELEPHCRLTEVPQREPDGRRGQVRANLNSPTDIPPGQVILEQLCNLDFRECAENIVRMPFWGRGKTTFFWVWVGFP